MPIRWKVKNDKNAQLNALKRVGFECYCVFLLSQAFEQPFGVCWAAAMMLIPLFLWFIYEDIWVLLLAWESYRALPRAKLPHQTSHPQSSCLISQSYINRARSMVHLLFESSKGCYQDTKSLLSLPHYLLSAAHFHPGVRFCCGFMCKISL